MNALIKLGQTEIGSATVQTTNARDLHAFLDVATRFNDWIASRIEQYGFIENQDFATFTENPVKGRPTIEYAISIDMAKELSMVERNDKGKQARQYFLECERRSKSIDPMQALSDPAMMRGLLLTYTEKVLTLESKVAEQAPKVEALDRIATVTEGSFCIRDAAKTLQVQERKLKQVLIENKWAYKRPLGTGLLAYSDRLQQGFMEHKMVQGEKSDGSEWASTQARITAKGMTRLSSILVGKQSPGSQAAFGIM